MKPRKARDVAAALEAKGFEPDQSHHTYFKFLHEGRDIGVSTKISHGEKEIDRPILAQMKKQLKFQSAADFQRLIDCPMSLEEYVEYLRRYGFIPS